MLYLLLLCLWLLLQLLQVLLRLPLLLLQPLRLLLPLLELLLLRRSCRQLRFRERVLLPLKLLLHCLPLLLLLVKAQRQRHWSRAAIRAACSSNSDCRRADDELSHLHMRIGSAKRWKSSVSIAQALEHGTVPAAQSDIG